MSERFEANVAKQAAQVLVSRPDVYDPTVGENIDNQIKELERRLELLRKSREELAPLLGMKISSLRTAMNY